MQHCWGTTTIPHTRSGHDRDRSRDMRTRNRRLGPLVQHPPPPLPGRHHTTTSRKSTHNNTKGSGLNKPPQNPGFDTPAKGHCTRYVALHPLRGAAPFTWRCTRYVALHPNRRGAMPTDRVHDPRHKLTCGPARKDVHGPDRLGWARRQRTPDSQPGPAATNPQQLTAPAATHPQQPTAPGNEPQTANRARGRQGLTGLRDDEPSGRLAALRGIKPGRVAPAPPSPDGGAHIQRARTRGTHTTRPGPAARNSTTESRPREKIKPSDPP